jgi:asparagine synthase (glutamine-hydrolysing)
VSISFAEMCGFSGVLQAGGRDRDPAASLRRMTSALRHRGPDAAGEWVDVDAGVALGHRRLSILDLSGAGSQPMRSASDRFVLTYNGEIYNFLELRAELMDLGARFRGGSDTEVMLAAIEAWGLHGALGRFSGMFAFALWDRRERALHLVRDRLGEKPLYYGVMNGALLFGSELKALKAHPRFSSEVDPGALALYLRYGYVPTPYTIYRDVKKLEPGSVLTARAGELSRYTYWSAREVAERGAASPERGSERELLDELEKILRRTVRQEMLSDVPLGAFLSGGIDSSTLVALMQAEGGRPVRTFTIGFHEKAYDEAEHARKIAAHLGTDHTELYVSPAEAMAVIPKLPALYDEPFADASQIPTFLVAELARRHVTVAISGDGGDELFGGYNRYFWGPRLWRGMRAFPARGRAWAASQVRRVPAERWDGWVARLAPALPRAYRVSSQGHKMHQLAGVLSAESGQALYHRLLSGVEDPRPFIAGGIEPLTLLADRAGWPDFKLVEQMMFLDLVTYLPDDILVKVDRATMGVSLESRAPLLDHRVAEFAWRLPLSMKIRGGQGKWLLRQLLYRRVPRALIDRPKMGFGVPVSAWLRGPLREWARELLAPERLAKEGFFDARAIATAWRQHETGWLDWDRLLWAALMFQAWLSAERAHA